jgi:hypothetical protein
MKKTTTSPPPAESRATVRLVTEDDPRTGFDSTKIAVIVEKLMGRG